MMSLLKKRNIALLSVCFFIVVFSSCDKDDDIFDVPPPAETAKKKCICPDFLKPGDKVAFVSPSYYLEETSVELAVEAIRRWGFKPVLAPNVGKAFLNKYAGTVEERVADLKWAYGNDSIKAIIATRGGYGAIQLLEYFPSSLCKNNPKWLMGYSDITTLHSASVANGVMSIHGTMASSLASSVGVSEVDLMTRDLLSGKIPEYHWEAHPQNALGYAHGMLVGGNLATFTPLIGTDYDFTAQGDLILFIEETGESARNIDRMMYALMLHGALSRVKGIVAGDFTDCGDDFQLGSIETLLRKYTLKDVDIPIAYGFPAGHGGVNFPLIEGAPVTLDVSVDGVVLDFQIAGK